MNKSKRILSLLLTIVMMLSIVPLSTVQSNAAALTQSQFEQKLSAAKSLYPDGSRKNEWSVNGTVVGWQCHGYARWLSWYVWGVDFANGRGANWTLYKSTSTSTYIDKLVQGDVVRYRSSTSKTYNHTIFITSISGSTIYFTDCNSDGNNTIKWNRSISKSTLSSYLKISLYGEEAATYGYIAHYTPNTLGPISPDSCNCSTSYAGNYICTTSSAPLTIRSGHGTSYSAIGSIPSGATVYVSKANGTWAHVTYNGVSGYASMEYLKKQGSSHAETPTMKWWISDSEWGDVPSSFKQGNRYYLCYKLYDSVTGKDWNSVSSNNYKVKLTYYYPDGSVFYSNEVANADSNWISSFFVKTGTYKYSVEVTGDFIFSGSRNFVVNENPKKIYANTTAVNLKLGSTESMTIYAWTEGYCDKDTVLNWSTNNNNVTCSWGEWTNGKAPLTIKANSAGSTVITLAVKEKDSGTVLHSIKVNVYIKTNPFHITYDANGGSPSFSEPTNSYGKITITNRQPEKTGYTFSGWNANPNANSGSSILVSGKTITLTQDMTFYAIWQPNTYTVKYNANGGTGTMANSSHTYDTAKALTANSFKRTGYSFAGWSTNSAATATQYADKESVKNLTATNSATVNLYARWKPNKYYVTYNANGGTGTTPNSSHTYDTAQALSANGFTRTGYTFLGWSTNPSATTATYTNKQSVKNLTSTNGATVTLYAVWKANTYTVTYNANGGSGTMANSSHTYDTAKALTANGFTRTGYTFLGWSTSASATTATYSNKQSVKNLTATNGATITLYAVWQKNPVTVSSIAIQSKPTKTVYTVGEKFDASGLKIEVTMSDGTTKTVTNGFTVSSPDMTAAGTKTVTVTYQGKTTSFNITVNKPVSPTSAKYKISGAKAVAGATVDVYISIENNPGIISLRNKITYDTSVLELVKVEDLKLLSGYTTPSPIVDSPYILRWADSLATQNNMANGNFVKLTFKIKDDAKAGDYSISVSHIESRTANGEKVEFADCSAVITVVNYILGDVDGNGVVDDWDAIVLNRYLAGWKTEANLAASDMDGNGEIDDWDAIALERKLAGWNS